ncbi:type II secretion system F family protein [Candidatus Woesebacteria bacterium]|nr:type II secretion system F family protein [Candidatus Woesebacteria bacterium]
MAFFKYVAKNKFGENIKGKAEARDIKQAAALLSSRGLLVIKLDPITQDSFAFLKSMTGGIKFDDIVSLTRQLSTMITAGLPLASALNILVRDGKVEVTRLMAVILQDVEGGHSFADSLSKHKKVFSRLYIQLVKAGETGGVLDTVLERLADNMEKEKEFKAKTKGALIYPVIVMIAMVVVAVIMMIFVIPKLTEMYRDFGSELPFLTRALIGISDAMVKYWYILAAIVGGIVFAFKSYAKTKEGRYKIDEMLLKLPIFGELKKKVILTDFARTLALLLGAGISLLEAIAIVTESVENIVYRSALEEVGKQVEKGSSLSESLSHYDMFPVILHQMMSVGEETGKLDEVLKKLSVYFEQESEHAIKNMTTAIEPMIMIVLGLGVGAMVIAIIMPIYNLTSQF